MKTKILSLVLLSFLYGSAYAQYCSISGLTGHECINRVQLGSIDNTSNNNGGYADYTASSTIIGLGSSQTITLTPGFSAEPWHEAWKVYIDYNQDGDFTDAGEDVGQNNGESTVSVNFVVPLTVLTGNTRMRVVMHYLDYYGPCGFMSDGGEAEDYTVQITCPVPTGLAASGISNTAATVSWAGTAAKYKMQYKIAGASTWTNVNNIADTFYSLTALTPNTKYSYRVQAVCAVGVTSAFSTTASFTTTYNYCSTGGSTQYGYINNVKLGSINNTSGDNGGYADYTALSTSIGTGTAQTISLTPGGEIHHNYWEVYIDYNHNADFTDPGEKVGQGDGYSSVDISFTVPDIALTGDTRIRIIMQKDIGYLNNPCTFFFGEAEDYTVNITTCNVPTGLSASSITADAAILSWSSAAGAKKYKLQYRTGTNPWTSVGNIADTFYKLKGLAVHTSYKFKVQSLCGSGLKSAFSPAASFTTTFAYCAISGITDYEWIEKVKLGAINNTSGNSHGYGDFTSLSTSMAAGGLQKIVVTPGFTNNPDEEFWQVYIDYNQNGDFYDADELIGQVHGVDASNKNISFTVPATALNGSTRMRVVMNFDYYRDNPCETPGDHFGEVEDYTVKITGGTAKAVTVSASASNNPEQNVLNSLVVSPNPVNTSSANLILQTGKTGTVNIKIVDLSGRILRSENIPGIIAGSNMYVLRNLNLSPGTYIIVAIQGNAIIARTKFIIAE
jgi:hypothetical protein